MFVEIVERDGLEEISEGLLKCKEGKMLPLLSYFKQVIISMIDNDLYDEADGYTTGFLTCLDMFRRQINSENVTLEDIEIQLANMEGWNSYLEQENIDLKNQIRELKQNLI